ncbi:MAG: hypothetical protein WEC59_13790 [Salibacteraceae bacterium]
MKQVISILLLAFLFQASSCEKDEEPFEYPEEEITEPTTVTHLTRKIAENDGWKGENEVMECSGSLDPINYALYEFNYSRGFATLHLKPDASTCVLSVEAESSIKAEEVASEYWDNFTFELTFSELRLSEKGQLSIQVDYQNVSLDLNLTPYIREILEADTTIFDANGLFSFQVENDLSAFELSGESFEPDFGSGSGNSLNTSANVGEPKISVTLASQDEDEQNVFIFNFIRITSFGIPE